MARKGLRLKVLRMIRGNTTTGDDKPFKTEEKLTLHERELERRIKQWLVESAPPDAEPSKYQREHHQLRARHNVTFKSEPHSTGRLILAGHQNPLQINGTPGIVTSVLYHPDFADWKACELAARAPPENVDEPSPEKIDTAYLLRVFDNAQTSLSTFLIASFGEQSTCLTHT